MKTPTELENLLNQTHNWPTAYIFKFIIPIHQKSNLLDLFSDSLQIREKPSKTGKYLSISIKKQCRSAQEVLQGYQKAGQIQGIISL